jgi:serine/threonine protein kinase
VEDVHVRKTSNLFQLPPYFQYNVGALGFGVWRELMAYETASRFVLAGQCHNFPLLYHVRILPSFPALGPMTLEHVAQNADYVCYWGGDKNVGRRQQALREATRELVICMEGFPRTLGDWYGERAFEGRCSPRLLHRLSYEIQRVVSFLQSKGWIHFDINVNSSLSASNEHIYVTDFGQVSSIQFDLSPAETTFWYHHRPFDRAYAAHVLIALALRVNKPAMEKFFEKGILPSFLNATEMGVIHRYGQVARALDTFLCQVLGKNARLVPYPAEQFTD